MSLSSCKSLHNNMTSDDVMIFQILKKDINLKNSFLVKKSNSLELKYIIEEESKTFFDYWEFNSFQNFITLEEAKKIFNEKEINHYKIQLKNEIIWNKKLYHRIKSKNYINKLKYNALGSSKNIISILNLSKIIYTMDKNRALVQFSYHSSIVDTGNRSGLIIYKRNGNKWEYLTVLFPAFS